MYFDTREYMVLAANAQDTNTCFIFQPVVCYQFDIPVRIPDFTTTMPTAKSANRVRSEVVSVEYGPSCNPVTCEYVVFFSEHDDGPIIEYDFGRHVSYRNYLSRTFSWPGEFVVFRKADDDTELAEIHPTKGLDSICAPRAIME